MDGLNPAPFGRGFPQYLCLNDAFVFVFLSSAFLESQTVRVEYCEMARHRAITKQDAAEGGEATTCCLAGGQAISGLALRWSGKLSDLQMSKPQKSLCPDFC